LIENRVWVQESRAVDRRFMLITESPNPCAGEVFQ
jgi:hypothetical protein